MILNSAMGLKIALTRHAGWKTQLSCVAAGFGALPRRVNF